jgi:hypothetical protein
MTGPTIQAICHLLGDFTLSIALMFNSWAMLKIFNGIKKRDKE